MDEFDIDILETEARGEEIEGASTTVSTSEDTVGVESLDTEAEKLETIEYIMVEEPEEMLIEVGEALVATEGVVMPQHTHSIGQIENLGSILDKLNTIKDIYSIHGGYAEFQEWKSNGIYKTEVYRETDNGSEIFYNRTGGVGFFVSLVSETGATSGGNLRIDICKKINNDNTIEVADVYGVTVDNSGFCGNQSEEYNKNNPSYAKVCLLGNVDVRVSAQDHLKINIGDYVVPNELGYAKKSKNNVGFKVISKGQRESASSDTTAWYYVNIALVPQNDNIARVMAELEKTQTSLNNVSIQLGTMAGTVGDIVSIGISDKFENIQGIISDNKAEADKKFQTVQQVADDTKQIAQQAETKINDAVLNYSAAVSSANKANAAIYGVDDEGGALKDIKDLQDNMSILAQGHGSVAGFVAQAEKNTASLATMTQVFGDDASYLTAIIQKIDENGAAIQHLVTHVDKYILGKQSPACGLTLEQTGFIQPGTIYVPTHDEEYVEKYEVTINDEKVVVEQTFIRGQSYIWAKPENLPYEYMWKKYKPVYMWADYDSVLAATETLENNSLWYCWQGIELNDKYLYDSGVLYCWNRSKQIWVPVASIGDSATSIGSVNQTAKYWQITYTDLQDKMASLQVSVDGISGTVENLNKETMSVVNQTAEKIMMGVYDTDDGNSTSLGLLLDGMTTTSTDVNIIKVKEVYESPPINVNKYENAPMWNGEAFVSVGEPSVDGKYYFDPNDIEPYTYYCEAVGDRYYVYGINNIAMANLSTRVTNTESEVESWTRFQKGQDETMTSIKQTSDEDEATISSMVYGDFRECVELGEGEIEDFSEIMYAEQPKWDIVNKQFVYDEDAIIINNITSGSWVYCLSVDSNKIYYKCLYRDDDGDGKVEVVEYEKYKMKSSPYASIVQKIEDGESYIGLVAESDENMGSIVARTINNKSEVLIKADKIGIGGTAVFSDSLADGKTTISGNYIRTGVITSNNYSGPVTYRMYGATIGDDEEGNKVIIQSEPSKHIHYALNEEGVFSYTEEDFVYYYAKSIHADEILLTKEEYDQLLSDQQMEYGYIVSEMDFDLIQSDIEQDGMRIDLNNGTIYSENFELDRSGNLSITGKITATSGFIGENATNGFAIEKKDGSSYYSLTNKQESLLGDKSRTNGVYIGPDGIGLGNGTFVVRNSGVLETIGDIKMYASTKNSDGTITVNNTPTVELDSATGNLTLAGNITLSGSITWDTSNSPVRVLYHSGAYKDDDGEICFGVPIKPQANITTEHSTTGWHTIYQKDFQSYGNLHPDYYTSYSYDGGETWTEVVKIRGEDGTNGTDAEVTALNVFNALTKGGENQGLFSAFYDDSDKLFINAEYIRGQVLSGVVIESVIDTTSNNVGVTRLETGALSFYSAYDRTGKATNTSKLTIGYANNDDHDTFIRFGAGTGAGSVTVDGMSFIKGTGMIWKYSDALTIGLVGSSGDHQFMYFEDGGTSAPGKIRFHEETVIDFTDNKVQGLKITFG